MSFVSSAALGPDLAAAFWLQTLLHCSTGSLVPAKLELLKPAAVPLGAMAFGAAKRIKWTGPKAAASQCPAARWLPEVGPAKLVAAGKALAKAVAAIGEGLCCASNARKY